MDQRPTNLPKVDRLNKSGSSHSAAILNLVKPSVKTLDQLSAVDKKQCLQISRKMLTHHQWRERQVICEKESVMPKQGKGCRVACRSLLQAKISCRGQSSSIKQVAQNMSLISLVGMVLFCVLLFGAMFALGCSA